MAKSGANWSLSNLPPEGHEDVGRFFWTLFEQSEAEKERLELKNRWRENHRIWRGGAVMRSLRNKNAIIANLIFSNIQRTVANLTAKNPSAEVVSVDGAFLIDPETGKPILDESGEPIPDDTDRKTTVKMKDWWNTSEQINILVDSALNMEIYGPTIEKGYLDPVSGEADFVVVDPFSYIIAPGNWRTPNDAPYVGQATAIRPDAVESMYDLDEDAVTIDEVYSILGEEREENRPQISRKGSVESSMYGTKTLHPRNENLKGSEERALVVELFVRDNTMEDFEDEEGNKKQRRKYPGGIRMVTVCNQGNLVLVDMPNPNVNKNIPREQQANTYLYDHFPYSQVVSYRDPSSPWGFAAAEQVGDLAEKMSELLSRMYRYLARVMLPPLVLPQDTGLTADDVNNSPGLILEPITGSTGSGIRYVEVPNLPHDTVRLFDMLMGVFDRVYQIEDADRGDTPNRIVAASAIVALQERNQVLMKHKIRQVDYLIRQRGRMAISFFQNFGVVTHNIEVDERIETIKGNDLLEKRFNYIVESGSTIAQTSMQIQEQALDLYDKGAIDNQALLETLNFPNAKTIIERMAENGGALDQAAQAFIQAGVPEEYVRELVQYAMQPQGGPGDSAGVQ